MKLLITFLLVLVGAVAATLFVLKDPGYVLIAYHQWTVETTLALFVIGLVALYAAFYLLLQLAAGTWRLPGRLHRWRSYRHGHRARAAFERGLLALAEGRWKPAERELLRYARYSDTPILNYLGAAKAAQQLGALERRDQYLHLAHESSPSSDLAVGLTQAQLQLAHKQVEHALATLTHLQSLEPRNPYVLRMLVKLYRELKDWRSLRGLLADLRKREVLEARELAELERQVYGELLRGAATQDMRAMKELWEEMPRTLRDDDELLLQYARYLVAGGDAAEAETLLRASLRRRWSEKLVHFYGLVEGNDPARQLAAAEAWLKDHEKNPVLLLTVGRLSLRNRLWGKARMYLEASLGAGARAETYKELATLLEHMGETDAALHCYREGMALAVGETNFVYRSLPAPAELAAEPAPDKTPSESVLRPEA